MNNQTIISSYKIFYFNNITPKNDPLEFIVYPGDTLYQGRNYNLEHVLGDSDQFAFWQNWKVAGTDCNPDRINDVNYINSNLTINPHNIYLDSSKWPVGQYWGWDPCFWEYYAENNTEIQVPRIHDNNLMFTIVYPPIT